MIRFRSWAVSHPGAVRDHNEDAFVDRPRSPVGGGGRRRRHNSGEVASAMIKQALERIPAGLSASEMIAEVRAAIADAHNALLAEAARRGRRS